MPLTTLAPDVLLENLAAEYVHAEPRQTAMQAFIAENEARAGAMVRPRQRARHAGEAAGDGTPAATETVIAELMDLARAIRPPSHVYITGGATKVVVRSSL